MDSFRERYVDSCARMQVEPLQALLDRTNIQKVVALSTTSEGQQDKHSPTITAKDAATAYPSELNLSGQTLSLKMCRSIADSLQADQVFTRLNLADTLMGDDGCTVIVNALKSNAVVETVDLRGNNIRSDGAVALAQLLKVNGSIKRMTLEWNCLGIWETGIAALADALSVNQTLEELDLRNNKIGPQGGATLANQLKHNTTLRRLDLRWNNVGMIGGRAFLDVLKWNKTVLYVELAGNELPEDIAHAIEIALERNREMYRTSKDASQRSQLLSSTLQQISVEHEQSIQSLRNQLLAHETQNQAMGQKLHVASTEIEKGQMGYRVLENKLTEERTRREVAENKIHDVEELLAKERRDHSERLNLMMTDLMNERGSRVRMEENYRQQVTQLTEKHLAAEAHSKEAALHIDLLNREKSELFGEVERLRREVASLQKAMDEQNRAALQSKRESDAAHRMELKEVQETFMEKMRSGETDRARLDEMSETLRARAIEWDNRMKAMEKQIRLEENAKRQELMAKLQVLAQHRESLQQSLNAHLQTHRQTITDYESKMTRERDGQQEHYAKLAHLTHERDALRAEMQRLKERADRFDAVEAECTRLKSELNRAQQALDRVREDEMSRAKDLERAVSGYVRSVERAERKVAQE